MFYSCEFLSQVTFESNFRKKTFQCVTALSLQCKDDCYGEMVAAADCLWAVIVIHQCGFTLLSSTCDQSQNCYSHYSSALWLMWYDNDIYTESQKNFPPFARYNFHTHQPIFVIFLQKCYWEIKQSKKTIFQHHLTSAEGRNSWMRWENKASFDCLLFQ